MNKIRWSVFLHFLFLIHIAWLYDIFMQSKEVGLLQNWTKVISNRKHKFGKSSSLIALLISETFLQCKKASKISPLHSYTNFSCFKKCLLAALRCIIWANITILKISEALHYRLSKDRHSSNRLFTTIFQTIWHTGSFWGLQYVSGSQTGGKLSPGSNLTIFGG